MRINDIAAALTFMAATLLCPAVHAQTATAVPQAPDASSQAPDPIQVTVQVDCDALW